jgi:predicted nucleic acid-binding protein
VDTSALAKRYIRERGSTWTVNQLDPSSGNVVIISNLTTVELFSAFARRIRDGTLQANAVTILRNNLLVHVEEEYLVVSVQEQIFISARNLVTNYPLRTLDAIQLACALHATTLLNEPMTFVSADPNLLTAAVAEGFPTDDPNAHP